MSKRKVENDTKASTSKGPRKKCKVENEYVENQDDVFWNYPEVLSKKLCLPERTCTEIVDLLDNDNTIPFIARYRKEKTGNMDASKLREFNESYILLKEVHAKVTTAIKKLSNKCQLTPNLSQAFKCATSLEDFEHLYQPFKSTKKTLANRARELGLSPLAEMILKQPKQFSYATEIYKYVNSSKEGLKNVAEVDTGVTNILTDIIARDCDILKFVQENFESKHMKLKSNASRSVNTKLDKKQLKEDSFHKFYNYFNFIKAIDYLESYKVLAINRGENLKILTVKVDIPDYLENKYHKFAFQRFHGDSLGECKILFKKCIIESYNRFIQPLVCRRIRSQLTKKAEKDAANVFAKNLKNLLLTPPVRAKTVMGIDPGFTNGCKIAVISPAGDILHTSTLILHKSNPYDEHLKLASIIKEFKCEIIGIGNGTACRETEEVVSWMIRHRKVPTDLVFCIVNESGISIYSVSDDAALELPDLEPNLRSAVSLARRVIDPLSEYVKVEPQHLGVGMYQHDLSKTLLKKTLNSIVEECVCDVGVDVNTCSETVLSKVSGLSNCKAKNIIKWRNKKGWFVNREQLQEVAGIGPKTYEQCAGFLRIESSGLNSVKYEDKDLQSKVKYNLLDRTVIHPESYQVVYKYVNFPFKLV
ncbi:S1 RNA binding domain 1, variant 2 [Chamberlinius hualienensis]